MSGVARLELVRRHLPGSEELLRAVRGRRADYLRDVSGVRLQAGRVRGVAARPQAAPRRPPARGHTASRSATRCRFAARSIPATGSSWCAAIYDGADETTITRQMMFHWDYLNETMQASAPAARRPGRRLRRRHRRRRQRAAEIARAIDAEFTQLARRDADRDREGVPARLRRHDRERSSPRSASSPTW